MTRTDARRVGGAIAAGVLLTAGCTNQPAKTMEDALFVRDGVVLRGGSAGDALPDGRRFVRRAWEPGEAFDLGPDGAATAPTLPALTSWWVEPLGETAAETAGGNLPDTALAFSPDSRTLAVATFDGKLLALETATGQRRWQYRLAPGFYKSLVYLDGGRLLIAGEQSADARVNAFDAATGSLKWSVPVTSALGTRHPPRVTGRWAIYAVPAVLAIKPLPDERVAVAITQSWHEAGRWQRYSRIVCLNVDGQEQWRFPADGPLRQSIVALRTDSRSRQILAFAANGTPHIGGALLETTGVGIVDAGTGQWKDGQAFPPLRPHFEEAYIWQGLAFAPDGSALTVGLADGRVAHVPVSRAGLHEPRIREFATPLQVGDVFVAAPSSYALTTPRGIYIQTNDSRIPLGTMGSTRRAPAPHPNAGAVWRLDASGAPLARYQGPFTCGGFSASRNGAVIATITQPAPEEYAHARHGLLLLDGTGPTPEPIGHYTIAGPAFFRPAISPDGFFAAVVECPGYDGTTHTRYGRYQVHLVH